MTRADRIRAFEMRMDGKSWAQIGEELGYTDAAVRLDILNVIRYTPRQTTCVYPALRRFIEQECGGCVETFARLCHIPAGTCSNLVTGRHLPSHQTAMAILAATGLSYDVAFHREEF